GGGRLLLQRFAQLVEQSRVLDGDDGLGGEVLYQRDLFVGERPDFLTVDADRTDERALLEHRHQQECPRAGHLDQLHNLRETFDVSRIGGEVSYMNELFRFGETTHRDFRVEMNDSIRLPLPCEFRRYVVQCDRTEPIGLGDPQEADFGLADFN